MWVEEKWKGNTQRRSVQRPPPSCVTWLPSAPTEAFAEAVSGEFHWAEKSLAGLSEVTSY